MTVNLKKLLAEEEKPQARKEEQKQETLDNNTDPTKYGNDLDYAEVSTETGVYLLERISLDIHTLTGFNENGALVIIPSIRIIDIVERRPGYRIKRGIFSGIFQFFYNLFF